MLLSFRRSPRLLLLTLIIGAVLLLWLSASLFVPAPSLAQGQPPPPPPPPGGAPSPTPTNTVPLPPPVQSPTATSPAPQPPPPGQPTATPDPGSDVPPPPPPDLTRVVRLWADYRQRELLYEFDANTVYAGPRAWAQPVLHFDGRHIYRGGNATGEALFTVIPVGLGGWRVFAGANTAAPLAYTIEHQRIRRGGPKGPILYYINYDDLLEGANKLGTLVFHTSTDLRGRPIVPLLAPLAEEAW